MCYSHYHASESNDPTAHIHHLIIPETVLEFLEVVEEESFANIIGCIDSVSGVILALVFAPHVDQLSILGLIFIINEAVFLIISITVPKMAGWIEPYERGLFSKLALKNGAVVKRLWKTALPLSVGSFLASAEWELLTVFAAVLGPAEAVSKNHVALLCPSFTVLCI